MPKIITFSPTVQLVVDVDGATGAPTRGRLVFKASNGSHEEATIGGADADIAFNTLGTAAERAGFRAVVAAAVAAGKLHIGDV